MCHTRSVASSLPKKESKGKVSYMTLAQFASKFADMSAQQDAALALIAPHASSALNMAKLCGGTALSRFYLQHRISYDLDFFVPLDQGFDAQALADTIGRKVELHRLAITHDKLKADQLHFFVDVGNSNLVKVSFVEDMYADLYPALPAPQLVGGMQLNTEAVDGLYQRKLRTVVGWAKELATSPAGGRQTARDMFDLYVLSQVVKPIVPFAKALPYQFPMEAFEEGIALMPWLDLVGELKETVASPQWSAAKDVEVLRSHIFKEIGMTEDGQDPFMDGGK